MRFPGKVLAQIHGKPLLQVVWEKVSGMAKVDEVVVAVDRENVYDAVTAWGGKAVMTSPECNSGTERISSIIDDLVGEFILNVQADECCINSTFLDRMVDDYFENPSDILTPVCRFDSVEDLFNPNHVKAVIGQNKQILYFSRSPVPYLRDVEPKDWLTHYDYWWHLGVYGYSRRVLEQYGQLPESSLERVEKLEQLRFLEAGYKFRAIETTHLGPAVDTPEDLEKVQLLIAKGICAH